MANTTEGKKGSHTRTETHKGAQMLYNTKRDRLLGKPSIETELCPFCGRMATNRHI